MKKDVGHKYHKNLLKTYLLVTFFYGILGFLDAVFFSRGPVGNINGYHYLATIAFFSFFFFSIIALIFFIQTKMPTITLVLPTYTIITKIAIVVSALVWASSLARAQVTVDMQPVPLLLVYVALAFSFFECSFSVYLLKKFSYL